jgi:hypothetical protein
MHRCKSGPGHSLIDPLGMHDLDVTILYPCLNEADAIAQCVEAGLRALADAGLHGEVLVVDNGSTDGSAEIAKSKGARVIVEQRRGYGSAYLRGLAEARGEFIVMLDADGTYPVELTFEFVRLLRDSGADMVVGNRFAGALEKDAMPFLNRYVGNPILSGMTRLLYRLNLKDIHCGMRAIRRDKLETLSLRTPGMEFATEMIVKAVDAGLKVVEIGIPYRPRVGESKLNPLRDAWRHIEYMLVFAPGMLFLGPGLLLALFGIMIQLALISGPQTLLFRTWYDHTNVAGLAATLVGTTMLSLGIVARAIAADVGMRFRHSAIARAVGRLSQRTLRAGGVLVAALGMGIWLFVGGRWVTSGLGPLDALPSLTLATSLLTGGLEILGAAFLVHVITLRR